MLRRVVLALGVALLGLGALLLAMGHRHGGVGALLLWGVIMAGGIAFERFRYKPELERPPGPGFVRTDEKTVDEGGVVTVWFNPATGERAYVRAAETPPAA